ncbi:MAG: hypothetical protein J4F32_02670 [Dehalococcoidia bacterium]|nr:hypothetical protein [Dehalococcoidia bacterium]
MAQRLLLATTNPAKAALLRRLCDGTGFALADASETAPPAVAETANSHLAIAVQKAAAWSRARGCLAVASDGGIAIPALEAVAPRAWESRLTKRATGEEGVSDLQRAQRLLRLARDLRGAQRAASRVEAVAVARGGALLGAWQAAGFQGTLAEDAQPPRCGTNGAWVESVLLAPDGRRYWQLTSDDLAAYDEPWQTLAAPVRALLLRLAEAGER